MSRKAQDTRRIIMLVIVFVGGLGAMLFLATQQTASSVFTPSQIVEKLKKSPTDLYRVRVAGRVSIEPVAYQVQPTFKLSFSVVDRPENGEQGSVDDSSTPRLPVVYEDVKPDMFTNGRDILVDGDVRGGVLVASSLLTQCPSKYEPKEIP